MDETRVRVCDVECGSKAEPEFLFDGHDENIVAEVNMDDGRKARLLGFNYATKSVSGDIVSYFTVSDHRTVLHFEERSGDSDCDDRTKRIAEIHKKTAAAIGCRAQDVRELDTPVPGDVMWLGKQVKGKDIVTALKGGGL